VLIEFRVANFRSIRDRQSLSMAANASADLRESNTFSTGVKGLPSLLRSAILFGPNAGGKTVALKSVALAALCVRAGLFVPAEAGARVDWFDTVLADIGDEQDIRESLSTFSAHMTNLAHIVDEATPRSLVLLDEIGTGTDPSEGAAVAQACLEALADRGARVIATTHYNLLKEMAELDPRFANASVEFGLCTALIPTNRDRMMTIESGVIVDWRSSCRGTIAPATANSVA